AVIVCALETGMRRGEILGLTWANVEFDEKDKPRKLVLPSTLTKTGKSRAVPVSSRLSAVLEMRRTDPKGGNLPATAHVFRTETGDEVKSVKTAWALTCRRAGIEGLHLHDLRREFGSRLLEAGASLHQVRDFLGHGNVSMTSTYLSTSAEHLFDAM